MPVGDLQLENPGPVHVFLTKKEQKFVWLFFVGFCVLFFFF